MFSKKLPSIFFILLVLFAFFVAIVLIREIKDFSRHLAKISDSKLYKTYLSSTEEGTPIEKAKCNGADMDYSGTVDVFDLAILANNYRKTDCSFANSWCDEADTDRDGEVDVFDLATLANNYGRKDCKPEGCYIELKINELVKYCNGADATKDGIVDVFDLNRVANNFGRTDCSFSNSWCDGADTDKNKVVDIFDTSEVATNYGRTDCKEDIEFSLLDIDNSYGQYGSWVNLYDPEVFGADYILKTYDDSQDLLDSYTLFSSRFVIIDYLDDSNGTRPTGFEEDHGTITTIIPFDNRINTIKIEHSGAEIDLNIDPTVLSCQRTCKIENESGSYEAGDICCWGYAPSTQWDGSFICVNCGDGYCSQYENNASCPEDCPG